MTFLETMNYIMGAALGASAVDDEDSLNPDAIIAKASINATQRTVLKKGWWFNINRAVELEPDATSKEIAVPADTISIWPYNTANIIERNNKLFNVDTQSVQFDASETMDIIIDLPWSYLPDEAQDFIRFKTAESVCREHLEDYSKAQTFQPDLQAAMIALNTRQLRMHPVNILNSPSTAAYRAGVRNGGRSTYPFPRGE